MEGGKRNLEQVRSGGADITNCYPFIFEVKRKQKLDLHSAWIQVKNDCQYIAFNRDDEPDFNLIPVVAFRFNHLPWEFLISASLIDLDLGFLRLSENTFKIWALKQIDLYDKHCITAQNIEVYRRMIVKGI
ncbi:MAG: hypothetical protein JKY33_10670 [Bacteroidia bacterium]|nr:hypothetical protein [Bacteroidia bacterium]